MRVNCSTILQRKPLHVPNLRLLPRLYLDQTTDNQIREIEAAGFAIQPRRTITETISGSFTAKERPGFIKLMDRLEEDDVLVVTKLDRLGRNAMDVRTTVEMLSSRGVRVHCLALGGVDLTSAAGKMTMQVIAAVAEFERDLLVERTQSGLARAKAEGKTLGRPPRLKDTDRKLIAQRLQNGESVSALSRAFSVHRATVLRARRAEAAGACDPMRSRQSGLVREERPMFAVRSRRFKHNNPSL